MKTKPFFLIILLIILAIGSAVFIFLYYENKQSNESLSKINYEVENEFQREGQEPITQELPIFKPENLNWEIATANASWSKRDAQTAVVFKGKIWIMGGTGGRYPDVSQMNSSVWSSEDGKNWELITDKAPWGARRGHTSVVFQNKIWILGGTTKGEIFKNDVWYSENGKDWVKTKANPNTMWSPRKGFSAVVFDEKIWVMGGVSGTIVNDVWYSENGKDWFLATKSASWSPRYDLAVEVFNNKIWASGGIFPGEMGKSEIWYSEDGFDWKLVKGEIPWLGRHGHCIISFKEHLWIIGGWSGYAKGFNDVWFSNDGIKWEKTLNNSPWRGREDLSCLEHQGQVWIMGGMLTNGQRTNDVWHSAFLN